MRKLIALLVLIALVHQPWSSHAQDAAADKQAAGDRLLGIGINNGANNFDKALSAARSAGIQFVEIPNHWDDVEKKPSEFANQWLDIADGFYPSVDIGLVVSLNPIDTNKLRVPADLRDKPLDDPAVIERYNAAADYLLGRVSKAKLVAFAIGNEIDGYLGSDAKKWQQFERFFAATSAHVRERHPDLPVGTKIMLKSLTQANAQRAMQVNEHAICIMTTYYPLADNFHVKPHELVEKELDALLKQYPDKPIYLLEAGCPSSSAIESSEERQAEFVAKLFEYWDAHPQQIKAINFIWLHDISDAEVASFTKYYGTKDRSFAEYLGSLGLRKHDGTEKRAFETLREQAKARGWKVTP